jgi:hypothetical protein
MRNHPTSPTSPSSERTDVRVAVAAVLAMLAYFVIQNHVDLPRWNNLDDAGPQLPSTLTGVVPGLAVVVAVWFRNRRAGYAATAWLWLWLAAQLAQWRVPIVFDVHPLTGDGGRWYVDGGYDRTLHVLPTSGARVVPDAQHMTLQALTLVAALLVTRVSVRRWTARSVTPVAEVTRA